MIISFNRCCPRCLLAWLCVLFVCLLTTSLAVQAQQNKHVVKLHWPPGTYRMTVNSQSSNILVMNGQPQQIREQETMEWRLSVPPPDASGNKKVIARLQRVVEYAEAKILFDSDRPNEGDPGLAFVYVPMKGVDVQIGFDADDTVVDVSGLDKLLADLAAQARNDVQKAALAEHSTLGDKMVEREFRILESLPPRNAVAAGDGWQAGLRIDLPIVGELKSRFDCKLKEFHNGQAGSVAVIEASATHELARPKEVVVQGHATTLNRLQATDVIALTMDVTSGKVLENVTITKGQVDLTTKDPQGKDVQATMKLDLKGTVSFSDIGSGGAPVNPLAPPHGAGGQVQASGPAPADGKAAVYVPYRFMDEGGLRDETTGGWLEAFHLLIPKGWQVKGSMHWTLNEKPVNLLSKADKNWPVRPEWVANSPDGRCALRSYAPVYWDDISRMPPGPYGQPTFRPGQDYGGMIVWPVLTPDQYVLQFVLARQRGKQLTDVKIVSQEELPKLAEKFSAEMDSFARATGTAGLAAGISFKGGAVTIDSMEGQTPCRERFICVIRYMTAGNQILWDPCVNYSMQAPRDQFDALTPVFTTMLASTANNVQWHMEMLQISQELMRAQAVIDDYIHKRQHAQHVADDYIHKVQREIAASHSQANSELARGGGYLSSPYNPYRGTNGKMYYLPTDKYHFMNEAGELLSQNNSVPPSSEWTSIEPYNE